MVSTRSRKRSVENAPRRTTKNSAAAAAVIDNEHSVLPPKAKRLRTSHAASSTISNAARDRKGRALKPVATNSSKNSNVKVSAALKKPPTRGAATKAKAKPALKHLTSSTADKATAVRTTRRSRTTTHKQQPQLMKEEETSQQPQQLQQPHRGRTWSTGATHALADDANTKASGTYRTTAFTKPDPITSLSIAPPPPSLRTATGSSSYQNGVPDDIDARDVHDPLSVTDYVEDMYEHFRSKEQTTSVDCMYFGKKEDGKQPCINESMRCILIDWLIEVHYKFKLFPETLYLTVNILDRFLGQTKDVISKRDLQLVGVTSLLVSAKYEEMYVPELRDLTYICDGAYTEAKILRMEEKVLKTLNYNVTVPTPHTFLIRFLKAAHADKLMAQLACFLLDGTLLSLENLTCRWKPSQLAAAAILLARRQLGRHNWSPTLVAYSLYREEDVLPVARALLQNKHRLEENRELMALTKKYSKTKYGKVSHIVFLPLEYGESFESGDDSIAHSDM